MAIQISGTTVIDNNRNIINVTGIGSTGVSNFYGDGSKLTGTSSEILAEVLMIGGGGGGGAVKSIANRQAGGGGGAGGYYNIQNFPFRKGYTYPVTVGGGGAGAPSTPNAGAASNGSTSKIGGVYDFGKGGGGGGSTYLEPPTVIVNSAPRMTGKGGPPTSQATAQSGGGGAVYMTTPEPGPFVTAPGGSGTDNDNAPVGLSESYIVQQQAFGSGGGVSVGSNSGAGGGAGGPGFPDVSGGVGISTDITGANVTYATGGDGAPWNSPTTGSSGSSNTGNGGGGSGKGLTPVPSPGPGIAGGSGGSGVVIIAYPTNYPPPETITGTYTTPSRPGYRVYRFTASGSITF